MSIPDNSHINALVKELSTIKAPPVIPRKKKLFKRSKPVIVEQPAPPKQKRYDPKDVQEFMQLREKKRRLDIKLKFEKEAEIRMDKENKLQKLEDFRKEQRVKAAQAAEDSRVNQDPYSSNGRIKEEAVHSSSPVGKSTQLINQPVNIKDDSSTESNHVMVSENYIVDEEMLSDPVVSDLEDSSFIADETLPMEFIVESIQTEPELTENIPAIVSESIQPQVSLKIKELSNNLLLLNLRLQKALHEDTESSFDSFSRDEPSQMSILDELIINPRHEGLGNIVPLFDHIKVGVEDQEIDTSTSISNDDLLKPEHMAEVIPDDAPLGIGCLPGFALLIGEANLRKRSAQIIQRFWRDWRFRKAYHWIEPTRYDSEIHDVSTVDFEMSEVGGDGFGNMIAALLDEPETEDSFSVINIFERKYSRKGSLEDAPKIPQKVKSIPLVLDPLDDIDAISKILDEASAVSNAEISAITQDYSENFDDTDESVSNYQSEAEVARSRNRSESEGAYSRYQSEIEEKGCANNQSGSEVACSHNQSRSDDSGSSSDSSSSHSSSESGIYSPS